MAEDKAAKPKPAGEGKSTRRSRRQAAGLMPIVLAVGVLVVLVIVLLLTIFKKPAATSTKLKAVARGETTRRARRAANASAGDGNEPAPPSRPRTAAAPKAAPVRRERAPAPPRVQKERPVRETRTSADRARALRTETKRSSTARNQVVTAISEGTAMIGRRSVREGDVIRGRVIQEIAADRIVVEYNGVSYGLSVGDALP